MLTAETKRHIDSARQVLVGKVPDPKQQIDQITNALIYKFMDDMDIKAKDAGGKASFFTGDLEKYAWTKLMDPRKGAQEKLNLYTEALEKFSTAAQLPQLFRDIFRQAFLPYRDPETLNLFLKEIEFFDYNHSEELGNAFEYLLSIMGSQGDAGQFRTPRHIIDFMVDIIDPGKDDTILDPACGTAGFLISAYKHIVEKHDGVGKDGEKNNEKSLTHQEKQKLMDNLEGYDISSDMVKLARVNMYLHDNKQPKIYEYDTLTSEERWGDNFDVIMANPPFMSPKGGIRPHNKFGVESSRAEVLFVDYIVNHLKQNGRAGIIVPEGVIFQSGKAYKHLRKALIEDGLMAVISLPSGVFNPYAGVKTSILIFDNNRSKKSDQIVFAKVNHDGFDVGAQRRPTPGKDDLPIIAVLLRKYRENPDSDIQELKTELVNSDFFTIGKSTIGGPDVIGSPADVQQIDVVAVAREKIAESGYYNLSASRYVESGLLQNTAWPVRELDEVVEILNGSTPSKSNADFWRGGNVPWFTVEDIRSQGRNILKTAKYITKEALNKTSIKLLPKESVLLCCTASVGEYAFSEIELTTNQQFNGLVVKDKSKLLPRFLLWLASSFKEELERLSGKTSFNFVSVGTLKKIKIPLPPIETQKEIVAELDGYQKIIDGARQVIENYKPAVKVHPNWITTSLGDVIDILTDFTANGSFASLKANVLYKRERDYAILVRLKDLRHDLQNKDKVFVDQDSYNFLKKSSLNVGDFLIANVGANIGDAYLVPHLDQPATLGPNMYLVKFNEKRCLTEFALLLNEAKIIKNAVMAMSVSAAQPKINKADFRSIKIPLPPIHEQGSIISKYKHELSLVDANKKLIEIYEQKVKDKIAEVWGE